MEGAPRSAEELRAMGIDMGDGTERNHAVPPETAQVWVGEEEAELAGGERGERGGKSIGDRLKQVALVLSLAASLAVGTLAPGRAEAAPSQQRVAPEVYQLLGTSKTQILEHQTNPDGQDSLEVADMYFQHKDGHAQDIYFTGDTVVSGKDHRMILENIDGDHLVIAELVRPPGGDPKEPVILLIRYNGSAKAYTGGATETHSRAIRH